MKLAVIGTGKAVTYSQKMKLGQVLCLASELHHTDCKGVSRTAVEFGLVQSHDIFIHPSTNPKKREFSTNGSAYPELEFPTNAEHMVDCCDLLVICPGRTFRSSGNTGRESRNQPFKAARYARANGRPVLVVNPGGEVVVYK